MARINRTSWQRIALEWLLCAMLTYIVGSAIALTGLDKVWSFVAAGPIGFLGSHYVTVIALRLIKRKSNLV